MSLSLFTFALLALLGIALASQCGADADASSCSAGSCSAGKGGDSGEGAGAPSAPAPAPAAAAPAFNAPMSAATARATLGAGIFGFDFSASPTLPYCPGQDVSACNVKPVIPALQPALALPDVDIGLARGYIAEGNDGMMLPVHVHRVVEVFIILQGVVEVTVWPEAGHTNVVKNVLKSGGVSVVPAGAPHGQKCVTSPCETITVFKSADSGFYAVTPSRGEPPAGM